MDALSSLRARLQGIAAVPVTPFHADGSVDLEGVERVAARLVEAGLELIVPCGNTGEAATLTLSESHAVLERTQRGCNGRASVLAGVGGDLPGACEAARAATAAGAVGLMVHALRDPYASGERLGRYYSALRAGCGGGGVPSVRE